MYLPSQDASWCRGPNTMDVQLRSVTPILKHQVESSQCGRRILVDVGSTPVHLAFAAHGTRCSCSYWPTPKSMLFKLSASRLQATNWNLVTALRILNKPRPLFRACLHMCACRHNEAKKRYWLPTMPIIDYYSSFKKQLPIVWPCWRQYVSGPLVPQSSYSLS